MRRWPLVLIGPIVSLVALVWILRQLDVARLLDSLRDLRVSWLALMIPVYLCAYLMRGLRWELMLRPAKPIRLGVTTSIIFLGMLANNLLPARLGELVRAFALRAREKLPTAFGLASIVAERIFDGATLLLIFCATAVITPFPESLDRVLASMGWIAASLLLVALAVVLVARIRPQLIEALAGSVAGWLPEHVRKLVEQLWRSALGALAFLRADRTLLLFALLSLAVWLIEGAVLWLGLLAFGLEPDPHLAYFTLVLIGFGVAVPSAPGYFGVFEACVVLAFAAFGLSREVALSYAVVVHSLHFAVIGIAGLLSLQALGLSFGSLRQLSRDADARLSDDGVPDRA